VTLKWEGLTGTIIGAAMEVHRCLGPGFVEVIYKNALFHELSLRDLAISSELTVSIVYKDKIVGKHRIDLLIENQVKVELKAASAIIPVHASQVLSYLKATSIPIGLLINFGESKLVWKRFISTSKSGTSATNNP
jgi:GxxExxY protein